MCLVYAHAHKESVEAHKKWVNKKLLEVPWLQVTVFVVASKRQNQRQNFKTVAVTDLLREPLIPFDYSLPSFLLIVFCYKVPSAELKSNKTRAENETKRNNI